MLSEEDFYKKMNTKERGVGDWIENKITKPLGIDKLAKNITNSIGIEDCGCEARKEYLNEKFPFTKQV